MGGRVTASADITTLLHCARGGDRSAVDEILRHTYDALHQLARAQLRRNQSERTLSATALVHEAYLRVFGNERPPALANRSHLLGVAARAMRETLIDSARRRRAAKRPQACDRVELVDAVHAAAPDLDYAAVLDSLSELERVDPRQAQIVTLRFFVGFSAEQIGAALNISASTVQREWRLARAWLERELAA